MPTPADPGSNQFRCSACGRYFNTEEGLRGHEFSCRAAKRATPAGAAELEREDHTPHPPNDQDKRLEGGPR